MVLAGRWYLPFDVLMSSVTQWGMDRQTIAVNLLEKEVISLGNEELWYNQLLIVLQNVQLKNQSVTTYADNCGNVF